MKRAVSLIFLFALMTAAPYASTVSNYAYELSGWQLAGVNWRVDPSAHYVEDYYLYYWQRLNDSSDNLLTAILYLQYALNSPFRNPAYALCPIRTPEQHWKYKYLLRMRIYYLMMRNYLQLGSRYDFEEQAYYYHSDFADQLIKHLEIGRYYYEIAKVYWPYVLQYANMAAQIDARVEWDKIEDEMALILSGDVDWDYGDIIDERLQRINARIQWLEGYRDSSSQRAAGQ